MTEKAETAILATSTASEPSVTNRRRLWLFRVSAIGLGVLLIVAAELVCAVFGWGSPNEYRDPFISFDGVHPLFVPGEDKSRFEIAKSRLTYFAPDTFAAEKPANGFRIFCLGGSTVQGRPYSKETSFTTWLQLALNSADSSRRWEVVNCGGVSYASYRLVPILEECLSYEPDLFIICTGHNEFLEERTYDHVIQTPGFWSGLARQITRLRLYVLCRDAMLQVFSDRDDGSAEAAAPQLPAEVDVMLDYQGGLEAYHRNEAWRAGVIAHFEENLRRMTGIAARAGVPVLFVQPPSNLSDCPPFKSEHGSDLSVTDLDRWKSIVARARELYGNDLPAAVGLLERAIEIDGRYAATFFELGKCYETLGQHEKAKAAFLKARDLDICPLRMLSPLEHSLATVAEETGVPLLDAHDLFEQHSRHGVLGNELLVDHVHPSFRGHQMIADALVEEMAKLGWVHPQPDWRELSHIAYQQHFDSLDNFYFLRGERTLESVRAWAQGRGGKAPLSSSKQRTKQRNERPPSNQ